MIAHEAELPPGVLNVLQGYGTECGAPLVEHPGVDVVSFTGSTKVGKWIGEMCGKTLKKVSLELGGKSPAVILADAPDMAFVAQMAAEGIYANAGQVCNAGSRLFVQRGVRDEFLEELAKAADKWRPGNPFDPSTAMGPLVSESQLNHVSSYMDVAREEGANVSLGGGRVKGEGGGYYFEPTILSDVDNDMRVAREEIFGPVVVTIDFDSDEDGIRLANQSDYGLAAGVFTRDVSKAHKLARKLRAGSVYVNCWDYGGDTLPFGGYKQSGTGRDKSLHALDNYTELKSTYVYLDV
jgi:acyl-CoA reductase-like NAD-dependent aldehyde dehydrogenase